MTNNRQGTFSGISIIFLEAAAIFVILTAVYFLTYSGIFRSDDEQILAARAQSLAFWNDLDFPQVYGNNRVRDLTTIHSSEIHPIEAIEPAQGYVGAVFFQVSSHLEVGGIQAFFIINILATAISASIVYLSVIKLGYSRDGAVFAALAYGLCTMAWPYSKTAYRDPLAAMFFSISFLGWITYSQVNSKAGIIGYLIFFLGLMLSMLTKAITVILSPALLISGFLLRKKLTKRIRRRWVAGAGFAILFIIGASIFVGNVGVISRYSQEQYLDLLGRYQSGIDVRTAIAFFGPFLSPAKSILIFSPILLGCFWTLKNSHTDRSIFHLPILLVLIFYAAAQALDLGDQWTETSFWGLRFLVSMMPILMIPLVPFLEHLLHPNMIRSRMVGWSLIGISFIIQLGAAVVRWSEPLRQWVSKGLDFQLPSAVWDPKFNAVPIHIESLLDFRSWDIAWVRTTGIERSALSIPVFAVLLIALTFALLLFHERIARSTIKKMVLGLIFFIIGFVAPIYPGLEPLKSDPSVAGNNLEYQTVINGLKKKVKAGDLVVVDSYGTRLWYQVFNYWNSPVRWFSLPYEIPGTKPIGKNDIESLSLATLELFTGIGSFSERVLYIGSSESPSYGLLREQFWLEEHFTLLEKVTQEGTWLAELSTYAR